MVDREIAIQTPEFTQLNQQQLDAFQELCDVQADETTQTFLSRLRLYSHDVTTHNPYGGKDSYWAHRISESINIDNTLNNTYKQIYETEDQEVIRKLFSIDLFAWNKLHALSTEYFRDKAPKSYPADDVYQIDAGYTYDVLTGAQPRFKVPLEYSLFVRRADENPAQDPAINKRLQFGMPRMLQLTGVAMMMRNFGSQTYHAARHEAHRLDGIADFLELSDSELQTVVQLSIPNMSIRRTAEDSKIQTSKLLNTVLTNDRLMQRFQTNGSFDPSYFGGTEVLAKAIQIQFGEIASTNAQDYDDSDRYVMHQWRRLTQLLGEEFLDQTVPKNVRTHQVITNALDSLTRNSVTYDKLSPNIEAMIDTKEFAAACWDIYSFWQANPDEAFKMGNQYQSPISLRARRIEEAGVPNLRPDVLLDLERPCNRLLEHVSKYADPDSEIHKIATERLTTAPQYDAELLKLLERSTDIVNHDDLRFYIDGFDDSDETTKWVLERSAHAKVLRAELDKLTEQIMNYVSHLGVDGSN